MTQFNVGDQVVWIAPYDLTDIKRGNIYTLFAVAPNGDINFKDDRGDMRTRSSSEVRLHKSAAQIAAEAKAAERKPWDVLREAAPIFTMSDMHVSAYQAESLAARLEAETSVPDPIDVLRRYDVAMTKSRHKPLDCHDIWRDAKRCIAAHDAKQKEV
jgi:hypothetical protein